jgi:hypothetical protein
LLSESKCSFWCYFDIISVLLWCCSGYIVVYLPFLAFYFCSAYFLYLEYYKNRAILQGKHHASPSHNHPMNFCPSPSSKSPQKKLFVSTHATIDPVSSSETVPSCSWTLSLVHSRPPQLIFASVLILLGQIPHTLSYLDNVQLSNLMKTLSC